MRRSIAVVLLLIASSSVFAWDRKGHRIIAEVAERRLRESAPGALKRALDLLGTSHLADVAMMADRWDRTIGTTPIAAWHFVNMPFQSDYKAERDCLQFPGCIVGAVDVFRHRLGDPNVDRLRQEEALIYLVHLVGDINQGWHCASGKLADGSSDEYGTRIHVTYKGGHVPGNRTGDLKNDNLHFFWDVSLIEIEGRTEKAMVEHLFSKEVLGDRDPDTIVRGTTEAVANETRTVAEDSVVPNGTDLDDKYVYDHVNLYAMDYQLLRAGIMLAQIIRDAFAK